MKSFEFCCLNCVVLHCVVPGCVAEEKKNEEEQKIVLMEMEQK